MTIPHSSNDHTYLRFNINELYNNLALLEEQNANEIIRIEASFNDLSGIVNDLSTNFYNYNLLNYADASLNNVDVCGNLIVYGDLTVNGTETIVNTTTLEISTNLIKLAQGATNQSQTDGAGIEISGNKTFKYNYASNTWISNIDISASNITNMDISLVDLSTNFYTFKSNTDTSINNIRTSFNDLSTNYYTKINNSIYDISDDLTIKISDIIVAEGDNTAFLSFYNFVDTSLVEIGDKFYIFGLNSFGGVLLSNRLHTCSNKPAGVTISNVYLDNTENYLQTDISTGLVNIYIVKYDENFVKKSSIPFYVINKFNEMNIDVSNTINDLSTNYYTFKSNTNSAIVDISNDISLNKYYITNLQNTVGNIITEIDGIDISLADVSSNLNTYKINNDTSVNNVLTIVNEDYEELSGAIITLSNTTGVIAGDLTDLSSNYYTKINNSIWDISDDLTIQISDIIVSVGDDTAFLGFNNFVDTSLVEIGDKFYIFGLDSFGGVNLNNRLHTCSAKSAGGTISNVYLDNTENYLATDISTGMTNVYIVKYDENLVKKSSIPFYVINKFHELNVDVSDTINDLSNNYYTFKSNTNAAITDISNDISLNKYYITNLQNTVGNIITEIDGIDISLADVSSNLTDLSTNYYIDISNINGRITDLSNDTTEFIELFNDNLTGLATYIYGGLTGLITANTNNINGYKHTNDLSINNIKNDLNNISQNFYPLKSLIDNRVYEISGVYINAETLNISILERADTNPKGIWVYFNSNSANNDFLIGDIVLITGISGDVFGLDQSYYNKTFEIIQKNSITPPELHNIYIRLDIDTITTGTYNTNNTYCKLVNDNLVTASSVSDYVKNNLYDLSVNLNNLIVGDVSTNIFKINDISTNLNNLIIGDVSTNTYTINDLSANQNIKIINNNTIISKNSLSNASIGSIALGYYTGNGQQNYAVAIGYSAGHTSQGLYSVAMGFIAGQQNQGQHSVALGYYAGYLNQGSNSFSFGREAGSQNQGSNSVALGAYSGVKTQGASCIAIGDESGRNFQKQYSIAIGKIAGLNSLGQNSIAIGREAGKNNLGNDSISIGKYSGFQDTCANTIILNATGNYLNGEQGSGFYVKPVAHRSYANALYYDISSGEISYDLSGGASLLVDISDLSTNLSTYITNNDASVNSLLTSYYDASFSFVDMLGDLKVSSSILCPTIKVGNTFNSVNMTLKASGGIQVHHVLTADNFIINNNVTLLDLSNDITTINTLLGNKYSKYLAKKYTTIPITSYYTTLSSSTIFLYFDNDLSGSIFIGDIVDIYTDISLNGIPTEAINGLRTITGLYEVGNEVLGFSFVNFDGTLTWFSDSSSGDVLTNTNFKYFITQNDAQNYKDVLITYEGYYETIKDISSVILDLSTNFYASSSSDIANLITDISDVSYNLYTYVSNNDISVNRLFSDVSDVSFNLHSLIIGDVSNNTFQISDVSANLNDLSYNFYNVVHGSVFIDVSAETLGIYTISNENLTSYNIWITFTANTAASQYSTNDYIELSGITSTNCGIDPYYFNTQHQIKDKVVLGGDPFKVHSIKITLDVLPTINESNILVETATGDKVEITNFTDNISNIIIDLSGNLNNLIIGDVSSNTFKINDVSNNLNNLIIGDVSNNTFKINDVSTNLNDLSYNFYNVVYGSAFVDVSAETLGIYTISNENLASYNIWVTFKANTAASQYSLNDYIEFSGITSTNCGIDPSYFNTQHQIKDKIVLGGPFKVHAIKITLDVLPTINENNILVETASGDKVEITNVVDNISNIIIDLSTNLNNLSINFNDVSLNLHTYIGNNDISVNGIFTDVSDLSYNFYTYVSNNDISVNGIFTDVSDLSYNFYTYVGNNDSSVNGIFTDVSDLSFNFYTYVGNNDSSVNGIFTDLSDISSNYYTYKTNNDASMAFVKSIGTSNTSEIADIKALSYPIPMFEFYAYESNQTTYMQTAFSEYKVQYTSSALYNGYSSSFTIDLSTNLGRMTYTGASTKWFKIDTSITCRLTANTGNVIMFYKKNGTTNLNNLYFNQYLDVNPTIVTNSGLVQLAQNDYIELYVIGGTSNRYYYLRYMNITCICLPT